MPTERTTSGRILAVDDDQIVRELVKSALHGAYRVATVGNGQEAWDFLQTDPADPIVGVSWWRDEMTPAEMEPQAVPDALKRAHGDRVDAAHRLHRVGISERCLYRRLARLGLRDAR